MKELISAKDNRKYRIVETLYFAKKACTIQYLAKKIISLFEVQKHIWMKLKVN